MPQVTDSQVIQVHLDDLRETRPGLKSLITALSNAIRALDQLPTLADYLEEAHAPELEESHGGDSEEPGADPDSCSYCRAIADARELLKEDGE